MLCTTITCHCMRVNYWVVKLFVCIGVCAHISFSAPSKTIATNQRAREKKMANDYTVVVVRKIMMIEFYVQITLDNNMAVFFA